MDFEDAKQIVHEAGRKLLAGFGPQIPLSDVQSRSQRETRYDVISRKLICQKLHTCYPNDGIMGEDLALEEQCASSRIDGRTWVVDPLCGSIPFSRGIADFIVSVACVQNETLEPLVGIVFNPALNEFFCAEKGRGSFLNGRRIHISTVDTESSLRKCGMISIEHKLFRDERYSAGVTALCSKMARLRVAGTCGLELAYVAAGRLDAVIKARQPLYDYIAGVCILKEAGGIATDFQGKKLTMALSGDKITDLCASNGKIHKVVLDCFICVGR